MRVADQVSFGRHPDIAFDQVESIGGTPDNIETRPALSAAYNE